MAFIDLLVIVTIILAFAVLGISINWIVQKESFRLYGLLVGTILGLLDNLLMIFLWGDIFFLKGTPIYEDFIILVYDILIYSTYFLLFKFEKLNYNQIVFFIFVSAMIGTLLEQFTLVADPTFTYPIVFGIFQWSSLLTLIYFGAMFLLGIVLMLFFQDRNRLKDLLRNKL